MSTVQRTTTQPTRALWLAAGLAFLTAAAYLLIGLGVLPTGDVPPSEGGAIIPIAAGCYVFGGLLILARRRWLWTIGLVINALVILFFFLAYQDRAAVLLSAGGVASKAAQILLEVVLMYLVVTYARRGSAQQTR